MSTRVAPPKGQTPTAAQTKLEVLLQGAAPSVVALMKVLDRLSPLFIKLWEGAAKIWKRVEPYKHDWAPIVLGLLLIFFGGSLPLTIAAIEAFRLTGWDKTKASVMILYQQYEIARAASKKDDQVDDNHDGIADVLQIDSKELITRKVKLFFKVADPAKLQEGANGVMSGFAAVVAVLKLQFAQTIALGASLGDMFTRGANKVLRPTLEHLLPADMHKWIPMVLSYLCRAAAITIAWWCQRVISALHSAMRGSDYLLSGIFGLLERYNVKIPFEVSPNHPSISLAVGIAATYYQAGNWFGLPFPFNILLLPLRVVEFLLAWIVTYD